EDIRQSQQYDRLEYYWHEALGGLNRFLACFTSADTNHLLNRGDKNLTVTNLASTRSTNNGFNGSIDQMVCNHQLKFNLRQKINYILSTAIEFSMAFLATEALHFCHSQSSNPNFR